MSQENKEETKPTSGGSEPAAEAAVKPAAAASAVAKPAEGAAASGDTARSAEGSRPTGSRPDGARSSSSHGSRPSGGGYRGGGRSGGSSGGGGGRRRRFFYRRRKFCKFQAEKIDFIDYKDVDLLRSFVPERGKIASKRATGTSAKYQRMLATAIKRARHLALLPFTTE